MSNNLNLPQVTASQNQKEVTINDQAGAIDAAMTETLAVSLASGDATLTDSQWRQAMLYRCADHTVARVLTVPGIKRFAIISNTGSGNVTVGATGATVVVAAGETKLIYNDGVDVVTLS